MKSVCANVLCGELFTRTSQVRLYCSPRCASRVANRHYQERQRKPDTMRGRHTRNASAVDHVHPGDDVNLGADFADDEIEFMNAIESYRKSHHVRFLSWSDVLSVAVSLGYAKPLEKGEPDALPQRS